MRQFKVQKNKVLYQINETKMIIFATSCCITTHNNNMYPRGVHQLASLKTTSTSVLKLFCNAKNAIEYTNKFKNNSNEKCTASILIFDIQIFKLHLSFVYDMGYY